MSKITLEQQSTGRVQEAEIVHCPDCKWDEFRVVCPEISGQNFIIICCQCGKSMGVVRNQ